MKCGKETENDQVFCQECLSVMEQYPVKPDTAVQLPQRSQPSQDKKQPRKKESSSKRLLRQYRSLVRWLLVTVFVLVVALCLLVGLLIQSYGGIIPFFGSF